MDDYCYFVTRSSQKRTPHLVHASHSSSQILLRGDATANFTAQSTPPTRRIRASCMRPIVCHYVRVPFAIRAINESRLCCLTINVSVVQTLRGIQHGVLEGRIPRLKIEIIAIITTRWSRKLHERSCLRWCYSFFIGDARKGGRT